MGWDGKPTDNGSAAVFRLRCGNCPVVFAVLAVEFDDAPDAPHAFLADDKAVLSSQVIGGNDIAGGHCQSKLA